MGQGQEIIARRHMVTACAEGQWVLLQNTHLSLAYLSEARPPLHAFLATAGSSFKPKAYLALRNAGLLFHGESQAQRMATGSSRDACSQRPHQGHDQMSADHMLEHVLITLCIVSPQVEQQLARLEECHENFRLWITAEPHKAFPIGLLQVGIKYTNEAPVGMKAGLRTSLQWVTQARSFVHLMCRVRMPADMRRRLCRSLTAETSFVSTCKLLSLALSPVQMHAFDLRSLLNMAVLLILLCIRLSGFSIS